MIVHNTQATNTPNNNIAIIRAEIAANKTDAQDYFREAVYHVHKANSPAHDRDYHLEQAKTVHGYAMNAVIRLARWNARLVQASSTPA